MFYHPWGERYDDASTVHPDDFPEFQMFEPDKLELTTITIV